MQPLSAVNLGGVFMAGNDKKKTLGERIGGVISRPFAKVWRAVKDKMYDASVWLHHKSGADKRKKKFSGYKKSELRFLWAIFIWPIVCFFVGYVATNINSFFLAFQEYNVETGEFTFIGDFRNFTRIFDELRIMPGMMQMIFNSIIYYLFTTVICGAISLYISFMIYKNVPCGKFFVVILFLPAIVSNIVWVLIYKYFIEYGLPVLVGDSDMMSLILNPNSSFEMLLLFQLWLGFGGNLLINTGAMMRVPRDCLEAASLEGCSLWREFWQITFPVIFQTWGVGIICGVITLFSGSPSTYAFFGNDAPMETYTFGYYFFQIIVGGKDTELNYPYAAAAGLMFTAVVAPITFFVKWLFGKGPNVEV